MRLEDLTRTMAIAALLLPTGCGDDGATGDGGTAPTGSGTGSGPDAGTASDSTSTAGSVGTTQAVDDTGGSASDEGSPTSDADSGPADTASSSDTGVGMCPDVGDPCTICESTECTDAYCGCYDNGSCLLLAQCAAACGIGDEPCNQACWTQYPDGISDGALLTHCAATTCMPACGPYVPLTPCQQCLYGECAEAMNVCIANPDCTALLECLDACTEPGCENTCYTAHGDGLADSGPVADCAQVACLEQCA